MAKKTNITYPELMAMEKKEFNEFVIDGGYAKQLAPFLSKKYPQKIYPRKSVPNTKKNAKTKTVSVADYDAEPKTVMKKPTFFMAKKLLAREILKIEPVVKENEPTFVDDIIAAANGEN